MLQCLYIGNDLIFVLNVINIYLSNDFKLLLMFSLCAYLICYWGKKFAINAEREPGIFYSRISTCAKDLSRQWNLFVVVYCHSRDISH